LCRKSFISFPISKHPFHSPSLSLSLTHTHTHTHIYTHNDSSVYLYCYVISSFNETLYISPFYHSFVFILFLSLSLTLSPSLSFFSLLFVSIFFKHSACHSSCISFSNFLLQIFDKTILHFYDRFMKYFAANVIVNSLKIRLIHFISLQQSLVDLENGLWMQNYYSWRFLSTGSYGS